MAEITATFPTLTFGQRGVQTRDDFVQTQEAGQDTLSGDWATQAGLWKTQANAVRDEVNGFQSTAVTAKDDAVTAKDDAEAAAAAAQATANASLWVSGQAYTTGENAISPIDLQTYRANTATSGTTDPSLSGDWTRVGITPAALDLKADKANPTFTGSITEEVASLPALALDPANGTVQYTTLTADTTLTDSLADGQFMLLEVTYGGFTLTLPTSTAINTLPDGTNTKDFYTFFKRGTTLYVSNSGGIA